MSQAMELLQQALLAASGILAALWVGRHWHQADETGQAPLFCCLLGCVLAAGTGLAGALHLGIGLQTREAAVWLEQASRLLGLPLIALASLSLARDWTWSRPTWGRLVIGLCVFFELARRLGWSQPYALALALGSALLVLYAGLFRRPLARSLGLALGASLALLAAAPFPASPAQPWQPLLMALALPLLAALLSGLTRNAETRRG